MTARFSIVPSDAFEDDRLTPADVRVLGVLGSFLDKRNECFPSQGLVAQRAKLNRSTVNQSLKKLVTFGYVAARQRWPGKARSVLVYKVRLDEEARDEASTMQAELFPEAGGEDLETPTKLHVGKSNKDERETQQNRMSEKPTSVKSDVASGPNNDVASGPNTELPKVSPQSSVSKETDPKTEFEDQIECSPPSAAELRKSVVFNTGRLLLTGHGVSAKQAGAFLGKLVKDFGLDAAFHAVTAASREPPGEPLAWLTKAAESEARRRGRAVPKRSADDDSSIDWDSAVARYARSRIWPRHLGDRPDDLGYRGPLRPLETIMANGRFGDMDVKVIRMNIDRLRAEQSAA